MEFTDSVRKRRMVCHFTADPVSMETIERIVSLAGRAPSAGFTQGQSFIVVTNPDLKKKIASLCDEEEYVEAGYHPFVSGAPVLVIPCTSEAAYHRCYQEADTLDEDGAEIGWPVPYWFMDSRCSVMLLLLATVNEGLPAGFAGVTAPHFAAYRGLLQLPDEVTPVGVIPLGHPAPDTRSPSLKRS
jgi:nitroreductase